MVNPGRIGHIRASGLDRKSAHHFRGQAGRLWTATVNMNGTTGRAGLLIRRTCVHDVGIDEYGTAVSYHPFETKVRESVKGQKLHGWYQERLTGGTKPY